MSYLRVPKNYSWCRYHDKFYQTSEFARYLREVQGLNVGELIEHSELQRDWNILEFEGYKNWISDESHCSFLQCKIIRII